MGLLLDGKAGQCDLLIFKEKWRHVPVVNSVVVLRLHLETGNRLVVHYHLDYLTVKLGVAIEGAHLDHQVGHFAVLLIPLLPEFSLDLFIICFQLLNNKSAIR